MTTGDVPGLPELPPMRPCRIVGSMIGGGRGGSRKVTEGMGGSTGLLGRGTGAKDGCVWIVLPPML